MYLSFSSRFPYRSRRATIGYEGDALNAERFAAWDVAAQGFKLAAFEARKSGNASRYRQLMARAKACSHKARRTFGTIN